jgi:hypothetical protein
MTIAQEIEIRKLREELQDLKDQALVQPFVDHLLGSIGVTLANTSFDQWPEFACRIFLHVSLRHVIPADVYLKRLPK